MEEEPILKKVKHKSDEEIREEAKKEFEREQAIKEQTKLELQKQEEKENESKNKRRKVGSIILRIFLVLLFLFILFETVMGVLDMQRLNDDKEPIWYISTKTEKNKNGEETIYDLGLYVIIKTTEGNETKTILRPFFLR